MHLKSLPPILVLITSIVFGSAAVAQRNAIHLHLGYHYNPNNFYLSPAELDSSFSPNQALRFGARLKYQSFFNESAKWSWHLQAEYSYRSLSYQFQTPFTDNQTFRGELEARYLDLGGGVGERFDLPKGIRLGWCLSAMVGFPLQSDTATVQNQPYPYRRATAYLPYFQLGLVAEKIFSQGEKGHWVVGVEPILRAFTRPLHQGETEQGIFGGLGFSFGVGYVFY